MKRIIFLCITLSLLLLNSNTQAQVFRFGVKAGATFSKFNWDNLPSNIDNKSITGFQAGIISQFNMPIIGLSLNPELLYNSIGNDFGKLGYLQIPINLQWGINLKVIRPYIQAGPYFSYAITKSSDDKNFNFDNIHRIDWGVGVGGGIEFLNHFQLACKYEWGIKDIVKNNQDSWTGTIKNRVFNISLGYLF